MQSVLLHFIDNKAICEILHKIHYATLILLIQKIPVDFI